MELIAVANPHTPVELAELSTLVHKLAGGLLLVLAIAMLRERTRASGERALRGWLWPVVGLVVGFGLLLFVFFHQIFVHEVGPFDDPVQNQHQGIGLVVGIGALVELIRRRRGSTHLAAAIIWPFTIIVTGIIFLLHEQGTTEALLVHWALAGTLVLAGLALLAVELARDGNRSLAIFGVLVLLGAAAQLLLYREEPGAHGQHAAPAQTPPPAQPPPAHSGH